MWEEWIKSADKRKPTQDELRIIEYLANKADYKLCPNFREEISVVPITDDVISPLKIIYNMNPTKMNGGLIAGCMFSDTDGVPVGAYLLANDDNLLLELDFRKVDYSPVSRIPSCEQMTDIPTW